MSKKKHPKWTEEIDGKSWENKLIEVLKSYEGQENKEPSNYSQIISNTSPFKENCFSKASIGGKIGSLIKQRPSEFGFCKTESLDPNKKKKRGKKIENNSIFLKKKKRKRNIGKY
jgi:hypothetical protein